MYLGVYFVIFFFYSHDFSNYRMLGSSFVSTFGLTDVTRSRQLIISRQVISKEVRVRCWMSIITSTSCGHLLDLDLSPDGFNSCCLRGLGICSQRACILMQSKSGNSKAMQKKKRMCFDTSISEKYPSSRPPWLLREDSVLL